jgi:O-antigen ligase
MLHVLDSPLGIMVNRNETGLSSSLLFTISFFGLIYNKYFSRILLTFVVLVSGFAVAFSFSKGAWLLTIIGAFLVLASLYRYKIIIMSILLILLSPLFSISSDLEFIDAVLTRFADSGESNSARLTYIIDSFSIGMNHIFLGIGPGNYGEYSSKANYMQTIDPHNAYLQTFAELGIVGFILVIILYFSALIQAYLKSKSNDSFILIYILILLLIADGFQSGLSLTMKILYVLLALIMSRKSEERETI